MGGKSMGGKRPPQQPPSKKRKANKKKGDDSSDSSSSEDDEDDDDSSSSSSEEEQEVVAKMPVKKRGKMTPATPRADSGDESSEFEDEFDSDYFKGAEDRNWMMSLTELDRNVIISERRESSELARESWAIQHRKKKSSEVAPVASVAKSKDMKETPTPAPTPSIARGRRDKEKPSDKNAEKRAALEDMAARKDEQQKKGARADSMEEEDDDSPQKRQADRRDSGRKEMLSAKPRHRQVPLEETYPRLDMKQLEAARVTRNLLVDYAFSPFFGEFVQELYVRVSLGNDEKGNKKYLVCQVIGVKDKQTEYEVVDRHRKNHTLCKHLTVSHAGQKKSYPIKLISNQAFEENEVNKWCKDMSKEKEKLPDEEELGELKAKIARLL